MLAAGKKIEGYIFDGIWFDIGRVNDYERFTELFSVMRLVHDLGAR
jgi:NDP-sugar pyrophosphorylase family protein